MKREDLISVHDFCGFHRLDITFIERLEERGLIATTIVEQSQYIFSEHLDLLERFVRLHQELSIHLDDLDIVDDLINRIDSLQSQVRSLERDLSFYRKRLEM